MGRSLDTSKLPASSSTTVKVPVLTPEQKVESVVQEIVDRHLEAGFEEMVDALDQIDGLNDDEYRVAFALLADMSDSELHIYQEERRVVLAEHRQKMDEALGVTSGNIGDSEGVEVVADSSGITEEEIDEFMMAEGLIPVIDAEFSVSDGDSIPSDRGSGVEIISREGEEPQITVKKVGTGDVA